MSLPVIFATLAAGDQNLSLFDTQFAAIGALVVIPCAASGQNAVVLTPNPNTPTVAAYSDLSPIFTWKQAQTSTSAVTLQVAGGLSALTAYKNNGQTACGANDLIAGAVYQAAYSAALGGFVVNVVPTALTAPGAVQGIFTNLVITNTTATTPAHQVAVTANALSLYNGSVYSTATSISFTIDTSNANGPNGLDTGSLAASTWYYIYAIQNTSSAAVAGLMSTNSTAPSFTNCPGYSNYARIGTVRANATPAFVNFIQKGRRVQYAVGTYNSNALAAMPNIANGTAGTYSVTAPTFATANITSVVPPTASEIIVFANTVYEAGSEAAMLVAPNSNYAGLENSIGNFPYACLASVTAITQMTMILESATTISWVSNASGGAISCGGYIDNL